MPWEKEFPQKKATNTKPLPRVSSPSNTGFHWAGEDHPERAHFRREKDDMKNWM